MIDQRHAVLVVEDNDVVRRIALTNLNRYSNAEIEVAQNGFEAVAAVQRRKFSLILMDVHMPEMDGLEATKQIRAFEARLGRRTPIVAVTASDTLQHCLEAGLDDFVTKPADYKRIIERWLPLARKFA